MDKMTEKLVEACERLLEQVDAYQRGWCHGYKQPCIRIGVPMDMEFAREAIAAAKSVGMGQASPSPDRGRRNGVDTPASPL